jgi:hypothetical protein
MSFKVKIEKNVYVCVCARVYVHVCVYCIPKLQVK